MNSEMQTGYTPSIFWWQRFINSMLSYASHRVKSEPFSTIIEKGLDVLLEIPLSLAASYYTFNEGDFVFASTRLNKKNAIVPCDIIYKKLIEDDIISIVLSSGNIFYYKLEEDLELITNVIIVPLISPSGILGIIFVYLVNGQRNYEQFSLSLISAHANQISSFINNYQLRKDIKFLSSVSNQKVAVKTEIINQKKRELKLILDSINVAVLLIQKDTNIIIDANLAAFNIIDSTYEEVIGRSRLDFIVDEESKADWYGSYCVDNVETNFKKLNGEIISILTSVTTVTINDNVFYLESFSNITKIKIIEETLDKHTNLLIGISDSTQSLLSVNNFESAITSTLKILGESAKVDRVYIYEINYDKNSDNLFTSIKFEWVNKNISPNLHNPLLNNVLCDERFFRWHQLLSEEQTVFGGISQFPEKERVFFEKIDIKSVLVVPIITESELWGFIGFSDCKKERKWNEVEESILRATASSISGIIQKDRYIKMLEKAKGNAEKSDSLKSDFLAQMSHEIRTPVNIIVNYSSLIEEELSDKLNSDLESYLRSINNASKRIVRTIDLILNMSEIQKGSYQTISKEIDIYLLLEKLHKDFSKQAEANNLEFRLISSVSNPYLKLDEHSVFHIFSNLIDNALKFTPQGSVCISIDEVDSDNLIVSISDTGIGIDEDYLPYIFEPFTQAEHGYSRRFDGNGLGLALVKKYCEINNAQISYTTQKDRGTNFQICFNRN
ncbi:MAG: ATP-binding protein [bacterium]